MKVVNSNEFHIEVEKKLNNKVPCKITVAKLLTFNVVIRCGVSHNCKVVHPQLFVVRHYLMRIQSFIYSTPDRGVLTSGLLEPVNQNILKSLLLYFNVELPCNVIHLLKNTFFRLLNRFIELEINGVFI